MVPGVVGFIEVKRPGGTLEESQKTFIAKIKTLAIPVTTVTNVTEAMNFAKELYGLAKEQDRTGSKIERMA